MGEGRRSQCEGSRKATVYKIYKLYWRNKNHFPLSLPYTTHYTLSIPQSCLISTQNPAPNSCRASLCTLKTLNSLAPKALYARIKGISQSLISTDSKALFKEKYEEDRAIAGEGKVLPRLWQRGFEGVRCNLLIASRIGVRIPIKSCGDDGLGSSGQVRRWRSEMGLSEVVIRTYGKGGWKNYSLCIYVTNA